MEQQSSKIIPAIVFALAIVASAWFFSQSWKNTHHTGDTINVTGSAKKDISSDLIVWSGNFIRKGQTVQLGYQAIKSDESTIKKYLTEKGVLESCITFSSIDISKNFADITDSHGNSHKEFNGYDLVQNVQVESKDVDKIDNLSREITELLSDGIELSSESPDYYYTKLAELKRSMLAEAAADARARAEKIAENSGGHIGKLRKADMGVFQITARNSPEDYSGGGAFNTKSKDKTVSITTHLEFEIQ